MWDIWANAILAASACAANIYGFRSGHPEMRSVRAAIAAIAAFYTVAYIMLLGGYDRLEWSQAMSRASLVVWPVAWILPAVLGARAHQRMTRLIRESFRIEEGEG